MKKGHLDTSIEHIVAHFGVEASIGLDTISTASKDFVPGDCVLAVVQTLVGCNPQRTLRAFHWGFNPVKKALYNTKVESASLKYTWRDSYAERRCIVPVTAVKDFNDALCIYSDEPLFGLAAIHNEVGVSILTAPARGELAMLKERQPLVVPTHLIDAWLDRRNTTPKAITEQLLAEPDSLYAAFSRVLRVS